MGEAVITVISAGKNLLSSVSEPLDPKSCDSAFGRGVSSEDLLWCSRGLLRLRLGDY